MPDTAALCVEVEEVKALVEALTHLPPSLAVDLVVLLVALHARPHEPQLGIVDLQGWVVRGYDY